MDDYGEDDWSVDAVDDDDPSVDLSSLAARTPRARAAAAARLGSTNSGGALGPASSAPDFGAMLDRSYKGIADRYAKAEQLINDQYRGSGRNELLLSLGAALLQPTANGKFRESLANIPTALLGYLQSNRADARERSGKLAQLEIARSNASELSPKDIYALQSKYDVAYGPKTHIVSGPTGIFDVTTQKGQRPTMTKLAEGAPKPPKYAKGPNGEIVEITPGGGAKVVPIEGLSGGPGGTDIDANLTGPEFEKALAAKDPVSARAARALIEGRGPPVTAYSSRNPKMARLIELAQQIDPTFDVTTAAARRKTRMDYTPGGPAGKKFVSANTVIGHLNSLAKSSAMLDNSGIPLWNAFANKALRETGDKKVQEALRRTDTDIHAVALELRRLFAQTGAGTLQEVNAWESGIANSSSPTEFKAAINEAVRLAKSRIDSDVDAYNTAMGTSVPYTHFLSKDAQRSLKNIAPDYFQEDTAPDAGLTAEGAAAELARRRGGRPADRVVPPAAGGFKVLSVRPVGQ